MFLNFKIKPTLTGYHERVKVDMVPENPEHIPSWCNWQDDNEAVEYRFWKKEGGHHQAYMDGKCNMIKNCNNEFTEDSACEEHKGHRMYFNSILTKFINHKMRTFL